jgi:putative transposase
MLHFISSIIYFIISFFKPNTTLYIENCLLKKENQIFKRKLNQKRIHISKYDKLYFILLNTIGNIKNKISIVTPQTLLHWQSRLIASFWTFMKKDSHPGRPPVPADVKNLILEMKNNNLFWGAKRIRDELLCKLRIDIHKSTIQNILKNFRRKGKIKKTYTWKKFLEAHAHSLFATDFFTVDTLFNQKFYVIFIISHKTREIVLSALTQHPTKEFVKQQIAELERNTTIGNLVYLIRDRGPQFFINYTNYNIIDLCTSVESPNMNAIAERFVKSVRNDALDHFLLFNQKQISKIIFDYIEYYNNLRPHQGINSIPKGIPPDKSKCSHHLKANLCSKSVLSGLHHHYFYKDAA